MAVNAELEQKIIQFVSRPDYRPLKPRMIAQRLNLTKAQADEVKRIVKQLVHRGQLAYGDKHLVRAAGVKKVAVSTV